MNFRKYVLGLMIIFQIWLEIILGLFLRELILRAQFGVAVEYGFGRFIFVIPFVLEVEFEVRIWNLDSLVKLASEWVCLVDFACGGWSLVCFFRGKFILLAMLFIWLSCFVRACLLRVSSDWFNLSSVSLVSLELARFYLSTYFLNTVIG